MLTLPLFRIVSDSVPPSQGDIRKVQTLWDVVTYWRMTRLGVFVTQNVVWGLEKVRMVPKGTHDVGEALKTAGESTRCMPLSPSVTRGRGACLSFVSAVLILGPTFAAGALVAGGQEKLFTPMMLFVCQKPLEEHK